MSASWVTLLFEAANFLVLAALLGWIFFRPVREALERRRREIEGERRAAAEARSQAEAALGQARAQRAELERSLEELRAQGQEEAESERARLLEAARAQIQRERDALEQGLVAQRRAQARALAQDAAFAAREIVVRLLERVRGPDLERSLAQAACRELERLRAAGSLAPVVVEAPAELDEQMRASLAAAAGVRPADVSPRLDPDLVAGLRVLTARGLVDASAAGLAAQVERLLVARLEHEAPGDA